MVSTDVFKMKQQEKSPVLLHEACRLIIVKNALLIQPISPVTPTHNDKYVPVYMCFHETVVSGDERKQTCKIVAGLQKLLTSV